MLGHSASDLTAMGFCDFANTLTDDACARPLQQSPLTTRLQMAAQLVEALDFLSSRAAYLHADLKARCSLTLPEAGAR